MLLLEFEFVLLLVFEEVFEFELLLELDEVFEFELLLVFELLFELVLEFELELVFELVLLLVLELLLLLLLWANIRPDWVARSNLTPDWGTDAVAWKAAPAIRMAAAAGAVTLNLAMMASFGLVSLDTSQKEDEGAAWQDALSKF